MNLLSDDDREKGQEEMELEPEEVQQARGELQNLTAKKDHTEKLKMNMLKELERTKEKALLIEAVSLFTAIKTLS